MQRKIVREEIFADVRTTHKSWRFTASQTDMWFSTPSQHDGYITAQHILSEHYAC